MTNLLLLLLLISIVNLALLIVVLLRLERLSRQGPSGIKKLLLLGRKKALARNIELIQVGDTKARVEELIGGPDRTSEGNWIVYLDPNSGYRIEFNQTDLVLRVQPFRSRGISATYRT